MRAPLRWLILAAGIAAAVGTACRVGSRVESFAAAHSPEGILMTARTVGGESIRGEVIDVGDSSVVALSEGRLVRVRWSLLRDINLTAVGRFPQASWLPDRDRRKARQLSRFPQGMTPEIETRFLAYLGQTEIRIIER